ncbi:MAG: FAD-dependent oxidoreductase [Alphaproteobacteria bacterium]|nr:FAD-dependent oxidoreductase [Alphaproteobacteria bacterium]
MRKHLSARRRTLLKLTAAAALAPTVVRAQGAAKVVVVGGGFGGAVCARTLKTMAPAIGVTLVEPNKTYTACPFSNEVIAGLRELKQQEFSYEAIARNGVTVAATTATAVDSAAKIVTLGDGSKLSYDRLVIAPGIDLDWKALPGYDEAAAEKMPHAWKAGPQTALLRRQLEAMEDGGVVVISVPAAPYRCPPAPYERASQIAWYLKAKKPRSKVLLLDAKDSFSQQRLFQAAWTKLYPGMIEWVPLSQGGNVTSVDPATRTFNTDFDKHKADVANVVPPQKAAAIAQTAGVADRTGWCPVSSIAFESELQPSIHVLGDAALMGAMPKAAFSANAQGKACAAAIVDLLAGRTPAEPRLVSACYNLAAPDYGFSIVGVYRPEKGQFLEVPGAGGTSPIDGDSALRAQEARYAEAGFRVLTAETFG